MPLVVNSRSRYARRLASVHSTPTDLNRFSHVPLDSSAASSPLPLATMAAAVLERRFRSMRRPVARWGSETRELAILPSRPRPRQTGPLLGMLTGCLVPHAAGREHLVRIPPPPVARR